MKYDVFFSICQTEVDGFIPSEEQMWRSFFDQVRLADELGYETAWVAETHLSCQVQKENPDAVIPHFKGEIGLNTDILQLAHRVFAQTKNIHFGSAIRNIFCNGGPLAHAEAIRTFMSLHQLDPNEQRTLNVGFASGRFPFSNTPYGIYPRSSWEKQAWPVIRGQLFKNATEIFLRALRGDEFSSEDVAPMILTRELFRSEEDWALAVKAYAEEKSVSSEVQQMRVNPFWVFPKVGLVPRETSLDLLRLTIGSQDPQAQELANEFFPVDVFNLSITPGPVIEETHQRMQKVYNSARGPWKRANMPRTVLVFIDESSSAKAGEMAQRALENYWKAIEGTLDPKKVQNAVENALVGTPEEIAQQIQQRFHKDDALMLWFDFNNHDNGEVKKMMTLFKTQVVSRLES